MGHHGYQWMSNGLMQLAMCVKWASCWQCTSNGSPKLTMDVKWPVLFARGVRWATMVRHGSQMGHIDSQGVSGEPPVRNVCQVGHQGATWMSNGPLVRNLPFLLSFHMPFSNFYFQCTQEGFQLHAWKEARNLFRDRTPSCMTSTMGIELES